MKPAKKNSTAAKAAAKSALVPVAKPTKKTTTSAKPARKRLAVPPLPPLAPQVAGEVTHVEIATRAYFIYMSAGCPEGQEMQHWLEAEAHTRLAR
jgi:hypothetical protein